MGKKKANCIKNPILNNGVFTGEFHKELSVISVNINKNILSKIDTLKFFTACGTDAIFVYEPGLLAGEEFPIDHFPDYSINVIDKQFLIVLTKDTTDLRVTKIDSWTPAARVDGRQMTILGAYNRQSDDNGEVLSPQAKYINITNALTIGLKKANKKSILCGDLNLDPMNKATKMYGIGLKNFLISRSFKVGEFAFTRKGHEGQSDTSPDWMCYRNFAGGTLGVLHVECSDHEALVFNNSKKAEFDRKTTRTFEAWRYGREADIFATDESPRLNYCEDYNLLSLDELLDILIKYLDGVQEKCLRKVTLKDYGVPYYNQDLIELKKRVQRCDDPNLRKILRKELKGRIEKARKDFNRRRENHKGHPWPKQPSGAAKKYIVTDESGVDVEVTDDLEMAEQQGKYWRESIDKLFDIEIEEADNTDVVLDRFVMKYEKLRNSLPANDPLRYEWEFRKPSQADVANLIRNSKPKASSSFDKISNRLVKKVAWHVVPIVTTIMGKVITSANFPDRLKDIKLIAVHKKGKSKTDCASYRPIAIQSTIAKIFDSWICSEITRVTDKLGLMPPSIHGYRRFFSCASAMRQLFTAIDDAKANNMNIAILGLDYSKAYDTLALHLCPNIIGALGAGVGSVKLLKSFLCSRPCKVIHKKKVSKPYRTKRGILQGASTSPKLFSIITTDKEALIKEHATGVVIYADDSLVYWIYPKDPGAKAEVEEKMKTVAQLIEKWGNEVNLKINKSKTELMCITNCKKKSCGSDCKINEISLLGMKIKAKTEMKFLGLNFDEKGTFTPYLSVLEKKLNKANGMLKTLHKGFSKESKRALFFGLVISIVQYCAEAYLPRLTETQINTLNSKVRKCLRTISGAPLFGNKNYDGSVYSATENMASWGIPSVKQIRDEMLDINTFINMNEERFSKLNQDFRVIRNGVSTTSKKNLAKYNRDSYTKKEFFNKQTLMEMGIEYNSVKDIKNQHKLSRTQTAKTFTERKNLRNGVKKYLNQQLLSSEKLTARTVVNNMRLKFGHSAVNFSIDDKTNEIHYDFKDF